MVVTVIGLGFVGLTTALGFAEYGHKVYGVESNNDRLATIAKGIRPFFEPGLDKALAQHLNKKFFLCQSASKAVEESNCIYYCVGTPYGSNGEADLTYLYEALQQTLDVLTDNKFRVLVIKSTIPPSTTKNKVLPFIEKYGVKIGETLGVANNPEFLREGYCWEDFIHADRIVLGISDQRSKNILCSLYEKSSAPIFCVSFNTGEFIKYLSNTLLATLISYSNEMSLIADAIGDIDIAKAFRILHMDKRWGGCAMSSYAYPGCGYGGYCLPKDTNALYAIAQTAGYEAKILRQVIDVNETMPITIVKRIFNQISADVYSVIGVLGLSFKPQSDDVRDTPSAKIINELLKEGFSNIVVYDPMAMNEFKTHYDFPIYYAESYEETINKADFFIILTAWEEFLDIREKTSKPVIDCRFMLKGELL